jgi:RimJ/RimL family protein N-acetyltransferase
LLVEDVPGIEAWFDDAETQRRLGGREWPRRLVELARAPGRFALLFARSGEPVGLLDVECEGRSAAIALVVAPPHRGQRIALTMLHALLDLPELQAVVEIVGEVESGNVAGERLVRSAGFVFDARTEEGFARYVLRR